MSTGSGSAAQLPLLLLPGLAGTRGPEGPPKQNPVRSRPAAQPLLKPAGHVPRSPTPARPSLQSKALPCPAFRWHCPSPHREGAQRKEGPQ